MISADNVDKLSCSSRDGGVEDLEYGIHMIRLSIYLEDS